MVGARGSFWRRRSCQIARPFLAPNVCASDLYRSQLSTSPPPPTAKIDWTMVATATTSEAVHCRGSCWAAGSAAYSTGILFTGSAMASAMYALIPLT